MIACACCLSNMSGFALLAADALTDGYGVFFSAPFETSIAVIFISVSLIVPLVPIYYLVCLCTLLVSVFGTFNDFVSNIVS